jgi:hypothetical protein
MSGNTRKNQITRLVTLRHRSKMSGALGTGNSEVTHRSSRRPKLRCMFQPVAQTAPGPTDSHIWGARPKAVLAGRHAKRPVAKLQLVFGLGGVLVLLASVVFTVLAVLVSVGLWKEPVVSGNAADAIALGATAFTVWLFFKARPAILEAATQIEQVMDYAQNERHAAGVVSGLETALDDILETQADRKIYLFGYSLGALAAMDFLYPRKSLMPTLDPRHAKAISTLVTVGCPIDFVRLYIPDYTDNRTARAKDLRWINERYSKPWFSRNSYT